MSPFSFEINRPDTYRDYLFLNTVSISAKSLVALTVCVGIAVVSGVVRFGTYQAHPPVWLDAVFLISCAAVLAVLLVLMILSLQPSNGPPPEDRDAGSDDQPDPPAS